MECVRQMKSGATVWLPAWQFGHAGSSAQPTERYYPCVEAGRSWERVVVKDWSSSCSLVTLEGGRRVSPTTFMCVRDQTISPIILAALVSKVHLNISTGSSFCEDFIFFNVNFKNHNFF